MILYLILGLLPFGWSLYSGISFVTNYNRVRHLEIPKVLTPICPSNVVWVVTQSLFLPLLERLPFGLGKWTRYSRWGWEYKEKYHTHVELGDVWMTVSPANNWVYVADPEAINEIFTRRQEFRRPLHLYCKCWFTQGHPSRYVSLIRNIAMLDIFGPNVATVGRFRCYSASIKADDSK